MFLIDIPKRFGIESGRPDWADQNPELLKTARLWPHRIKGEGHFVALIGRQGDFVVDDSNLSSDEPLKSYRRFCDDMMHNPLQGIYHVKGTQLSIIPPEFKYNPKLKIVMTGLYVGNETNGKFEPSQSLAMALQWENIKRKKSFSLDDSDLVRYLKGETLMFNDKKGYILLGVDDFPVGWGKIRETGLKNLYPKGWRKTR